MILSHTAKQLLGACAGMAIAGLVYIGVDQASNLSIKGLLVSTNNISTNPGTNINAKDVDPDTLRRITSRAQTVATALENSTVPTQAETPLTASAEARRLARIAEDERAALAANAKTYSNDPNTVMTEQDRLAIRSARFAAAGDAPSSAGTQIAGIPQQPVYVPQTVIQRVEVPVDREVIKEVVKEVPVVKEVIKEVPVTREVIKEVPRDVVREVIKEVPKEVIKTVVKEVPVYINTPQVGKTITPVPYRDLSNSGPGLFILVGSSAAIALKRVRRRNDTSM